MRSIGTSLARICAFCLAISFCAALISCRAVCTSWLSDDDWYLKQSCEITRTRNFFVNNDHGPGWKPSRGGAGMALNRIGRTGKHQERVRELDLVDR